MLSTLVLPVPATSAIVHNTNATGKNNGQISSRLASALSDTPQALPSEQDERKSVGEEMVPFERSQTLRPLHTRTFLITANLSVAQFICAIWA